MGAWGDEWHASDSAQDAIQYTVDEAAAKADAAAEKVISNPLEVGAIDEFRLRIGILMGIAKGLSYDLWYADYRKISAAIDAALASDLEEAGRVNGWFEPEHFAAQVKKEFDEWDRVVRRD